MHVARSGRSWLRPRVCVVVCLVLVFAASCRDARRDPDPGVEPDRANVPYGKDHSRQAFDIYLPAGDGPFPAVVWIHGGGWVEGDKSQVPVTSLVYDGYAVLSANYRFAGEGPFMAPVDDIAKLYNFLADHASEFAIDPDKIVLMGFSAGGHIAALVGFTVTIGGERGPAAVVASGAPSHFTVPLPADYAGIVGDLLGCLPADCPDRAAEASVTTYVHPAGPPVLLQHSADDRVVPYSQAAFLEEALTTSGVPVQMDVISGFHDFVLDEEVRSFVAAAVG